MLREVLGLFGLQVSKKSLGRSPRGPFKWASLAALLGLVLLGLAEGGYRIYILVENRMELDQ